MVVAKDSKDWTWVLDAPCRECGFVAVSVDPHDVAQLARDNAAAWQVLLASTATPTEPVSPDAWSTLEYACHVRDVHRIYLQRLELMLAENDPLFANWDQDETAARDRYAEQEPGVVGRELVAAASSIADRFGSLAGDQWGRTGRRSDGASFTIASLARYYAHDWVHHLHDVGGR